MRFAVVSLLVFGVITATDSTQGQSGKEEVFKKSDANGDGVLSATEYRTVVPRDQNETMTGFLDSVTDFAFYFADANGDGEITWPEFDKTTTIGENGSVNIEASSSNENSQVANERRENLFQKLDVDHDNYISASEFQLMTANDENKPDLPSSLASLFGSLATAAFDSTDTDKDGRISHDEFVQRDGSANETSESKPAAASAPTNFHVASGGVIKNQFSSNGESGQMPLSEAVLSNIPRDMKFRPIFENFPSNIGSTASPITKIPVTSPPPIFGNFPSSIGSTASPVTKIPVASPQPLPSFAQVDASGDQRVSVTEYDLSRSPTVSESKRNILRQMVQALQKDENGLDATEFDFFSKFEETALAVKERPGEPFEFTLFDKDGNRVLNLDEFHYLVTILKKSGRGHIIPTCVIDYIFSEIDRNGDQVLSPFELQSKPLLEISK